MDGIINVYKEAGYTSFDVVAKLRGILHQKKIGHTGTLDPDATGVLPVCLGKATKVCDLLTDKDKTYQAVCQLGVETDTQDMTGEVLQKSSWKGLSEQDILQCVATFVGEISQIPPMYSAIKVNGTRLYELARQGKTVERKPRNVKVLKIVVGKIDLEKGTFEMEVTCSKGTYIRTLCHDIGETLGCHAAMDKLVRTRVSMFEITEALTLQEISNLVEDGKGLEDKLHKVDSLFPQLPRYQILEQYAPKLKNGNRLEIRHLKPLSLQPGESQDILLYDENGCFKAVYRKIEQGYKVHKMF